MFGLTINPPNNIMGIQNIGVIYDAITILSAIALMVRPIAAPHYTSNSRAI